MTKKDIALSVGGVLASCVVSYLLYKMEQRDSAVTAANAAATAAADAANQQQEEEQQAEYLSELPTISGSTADSTTEGISDISAGTTASSAAADPTITAILGALYPTSSTTTGVGIASNGTVAFPTTTTSTGTAATSSSGSSAGTVASNTVRVVSQ